ncbi:alpha/beta hydrolase [Pseudoduganella danionis]|nr:alpha/beta fold hydrolase [Pseudoduganella danionis]
MKLLLSLLLLSSSAFAASVPVTLDVGGAAVYGTELTPDGVQGKLPVVLLHAGSGPTDRDGNNHLLPGPNDSLKLLAEGLARHGIASVRYDKRGIAASANPRWREQELRFDDYIADAAAWAARLRTDARFSRVILIGHSEGAQIVAEACAIAKADGCVLLAGAGHPADELLREQLAKQLPPPLLAENERILAALKQGQPVADVPAPLQALYHASVQPYLISWLQHDPRKAVAGLSMPVLIVQGTSDVQVPVSEAQALAAAAPRARLQIIDGMNHLLKMVGTDAELQRKSYGSPDLPVAPQLLDSVNSFIDQLAR